MLAWVALTIARNKSIGGYRQTLDLAEGQDADSERKRTGRKPSRQERSCRLCAPMQAGREGKKSLHWLSSDSWSKSDHQCTGMGSRGEERGERKAGQFLGDLNWSWVKCDRIGKSRGWRFSQAILRWERRGWKGRGLWGRGQVRKEVITSTCLRFFSRVRRNPSEQAFPGKGLFHRNGLWTESKGRREGLREREGKRLRSIQTPRRPKKCWILEQRRGWCCWW